MKNEFYQDYKERVMPALQKQHGYKNVNQIPKVDKVVINSCVGSQSTGGASTNSTPDFFSASVTAPSVGSTDELDTSSTRFTPRCARKSAHCSAQPLPKTMRGGWSRVMGLMDDFFH